MTEPVLSTVLVVCRECFPYHDAKSLPHIVRLLNDYLDTFSTVADACGSGLSKRALDYLAVRDPEWTNGKFAVHHAVTKGYVHVLQWLNDYYPERALWCWKVTWRIWTVTCLMELAVRARQLPVLQWLHANRTEKCTPEAMDEAAKIGRLDIIQWLYENRTEGCTTNALVNAAENGNIEIEKWLHYHYTPRMSWILPQDLETLKLWNGFIRIAVKDAPQKPWILLLVVAIWKSYVFFTRIEARDV